MPIFATNTGTFSPLSIKGIHATGSVADFLIQNSLRFDSSSSSYLHETPGSVGNRKTFTFSAWVKRGSISSGQQGLFNAGTNISGNSDFFGVRFFNTDFLNVTTGSTNLVTSTGTFTDVAAWYHIVVTGDTNLSTNKFKIYVNGVLNNQGGVLTDGTELAVGNTNIHEIGRTSWSTNEYFDGYLSEVHYVDGAALSPTDFGEFNSETGIWTPIQYTGATATTGPWPGFSRGATSSGDTHSTTSNTNKLQIDTGVLGDYNITITKTGGSNDIYLETSTTNGSYSLIENGLSEVILTNTGTPSHTYDRWVQIQGSGGGNVTVTITGTALGTQGNGANGVHLNFSNHSSNQHLGIDANKTVRYWPDVTGTNISSTVRNLFDGNTGLSVDGTHSTPITFTPSTPIPYSSVVECYTASGLTERTYSLNGGTGVTNVANGWTTLDTGSGTITSITITPNTNYSQAWSAIRVDGVILTDPNDYTVNNLTASGLGNTPGVTTQKGQDVEDDWLGILGITPTNTNGPFATIPDGGGPTQPDKGKFYWSGLTVGDTITLYGTGSGQNRTVTGDVSEASSPGYVAVPGASLGSFTVTVTAASGSCKVDHNGAFTCYGITPGPLSSRYFNNSKDSPMSGDASADTGLGGQLSTNYCTYNSNDMGTVTLKNGGLEINTAATDHCVRGTIAIPESVKIYYEFTVTQRGGGGAQSPIVGVALPSLTLTQNPDSQTSTHWSYSGSGQKLGGGATYTNYGTSLSAGDVIGVAIDRSSGRIWFSHNGTWQNSGDPTDSTDTNAAFTNVPITGTLHVFFGNNNGTPGLGLLNTGQSAFSNAAPTGYKCLCTANLPDVTIVDGTTALSIVEWDGVDGTADTVSGLNLVNDPGFIWTKATNHGYHNTLWDIVRGYNLTNALITDYNGSASGGKITSVTPSSFSHDGGVWFNENARKYVAWAWDGGAPSNVFSNSTYNQSEVWSGNVSSYVSALGSEPTINLFDGDTSTSFYSDSASGSGIKFVPATSITGSIELYLRNGDTANSTFSYSLDNGSTFTNLTTTAGNGSYVSIGSQTISNTNGIIVKHVTTAGTNSVNWRAIKVDNKVLVDAGYVPVGGANDIAYEQGAAYNSQVTGTSQSYDFGDGGLRGDNYMFDGDIKHSTAALGLNNDITWSGSISFTTSFAIASDNDGGSNAINITHGPNNTVTNVRSQVPNTTNSQINIAKIPITTLHGITSPVTQIELVGGGSAANGLCMVVADGKILVDNTITPTNVPERACRVRANQTAGFSIVRVDDPNATEGRFHGLTKTPEFIMAKATATLSENWHTFHVAYGKSHYGIFGNNAYNSSDQWGSREPNDSTFYVKPATGSGANYAGGMIYYIWHSVPGFSAFGSFVGDGLDPGPFVFLGFKPALILLKNGDGGDWIMHDTKRSPYNEAYKFLRPNSSDGQNTTANNQSIDIFSNGFRIKAATSTNASVNGSGNKITYCAWAENPFKQSLAH